MATWPPRLFKYMPSQYVDQFVDQGRILFRSLTYFRDYARDGVRGDIFEGRHIDRPKSGATLEVLADSKVIHGDLAFVNSVCTDSVFAMCSSMRHDVELYNAFGADACVEITSPIQFVRDCRRALRDNLRCAEAALLHGRVEYYHASQWTSTNAKDPKNLVFFKPRAYASQYEYRVVLARAESMKLTEQIIIGTALHETEVPTSAPDPDLHLQLHGHRDYMRVHYR